MGFVRYNSNRKSGTKLLKPMGFEFTFELKGEPEPNYDNRIMRNAIHRLSNLFNDSNVHWDGGCIEISSPIFTYMEDVLEYYSKIKTSLGNKFIPKNKNSTGGGTHIHVGISSKPNSKFTMEDKRFRSNLMTLIWNRPWLTWGFQDPSDDISSQPICVKNPTDINNGDWRYNSIYKPHQIFIPGFEQELWTGRFIKNRNENGNVQYNLGEKGTSVRDTSYETVELRFFDTVESVEELEVFIKVANHLVKKALTEPREKIMPNKTYSELIKNLLTGKDLVKFKRFLKEVGVEYTTDKIRERAYLMNPRNSNKIETIMKP